VLGARVTGEDLALSIARKFLASSFEGGRHQKRLDKITAIENAG
jgi:ribose 5-phosphate isomerase B